MPAARDRWPLAVPGGALRVSICAARSIPEQVAFLLDALSQFRIVSIAGQDLEVFSLAPLRALRQPLGRAGAASQQLHARG